MELIDRNEVLRQMRNSRTDCPSEDDLKAMVDHLEDDQEAIEKYLQRKGVVESG